MKMKIFLFNNSLKKFVFSYSMFLSLLISCSENGTEVEQYHPDALRVAGSYEATKLLMPNFEDGLIDVLKEGGNLEIELNKNFEAMGSWKLPGILFGHGEEDYTESFSGTYTVNNDTLQFNGFQNFLSHPRLYYIIKGDSLKAFFDSLVPTTIYLLKK